MSANCCGQDAKFDGLDPRYKRVLWTVIAINATMFIVELTAGVLAGSQALQADALDFLGDTLTYGISLLVIGMSLRVRATAALAKGVSLTLMGLWVFGSTAYHVLVLGVPRAEIMGVIGFLALAANLASVGLLLPYKDGEPMPNRNHHNCATHAPAKSKSKPTLLRETAPARSPKTAKTTTFQPVPSATALKVPIVDSY